MSLVYLKNRWEMTSFQINTETLLGPSLLWQLYFFRSGFAKNRPLVNFSYSQISKNSQSKRCHFQTFSKLNSTFAFITKVVFLSTRLAVILKFPFLCTSMPSWCFDHKGIQLTSRWSAMFWLRKNLCMRTAVQNMTNDKLSIDTIKTLSKKSCNVLTQYANDVVLTLWTLYRRQNDAVCVLGSKPSLFFGENRYCKTSHKFARKCCESDKDICTRTWSSRTTVIFLEVTL